MSTGLGEIQARVASIQTRIQTISGQGAPMGSVGTAGAISRGTAGAISRTGTSSTLASSMSGTDFANALQDVAASGAAPSGSGSVSGGTVSGDAVVAGAKSYLGVPYVWGGTDPATGLDCSGLVQRVYADLGVSLPRVSQDQAKAGSPVASLAQARPGDLIVTRNAQHIGIYAGNGQWIEAPKPGLAVRLTTAPTDITTIRRVLTTPAVGASARGATAYQDLFDAATAKYQLPAGMLSAVAKAESNYNPAARSSAGAVGLMQLMPSTAAGMGVDPSDPAQAIDGAGRLLSRNLKKFGSVPLALAAYNAGVGAVSSYHGIPPYAETQSYVRKVQQLMQELS